jgi:hypothetical protein
MTQETAQSGDQRVRLLRERFFNRFDVAAFLARWGKPHPVELRDNLDALLRAHVLGSEAPAAKVAYRTRKGICSEQGHFRIGAYTPGPGGQTKWLCIDLDGGEDHATGLADPQGVACDVMARFAERGVQAYLERSGGGKGWHVWCFFGQPIYAARARRLALICVPENARLSNGEQAVPAANRGIEIFPKQTRHRRDGKGYGNLVWLPWWHGAPEGANTFYQIDAAGDLVPAAVTAFESVPAETLRRVIPMKEEIEYERNPAARPAANSPAPRRPAPSPEWKQWRKDALECLDLDRVYGEQLTGGSSGNGWLECRDPESPSGDRDPSSGVADGTGEAERGAFHSFLTEDTFSVFDYLVRDGRASDFREAQRLVAEWSGVPFPSGQSGSPPDASGAQDAEAEPQRPEIQVNKRQLDAVCADAVDALIAWNETPDQAGTPRPYVYTRSSQLVRLVRRHDGLAIEAMNENAVYGLLARAADWIKFTSEGRVPCAPVRDVARDMLAFPSPRLPAIESVAATPLFARDGRLVAARGYDAEERLWLEPARSLRQLAVADPLREIARSKELLLTELLGDFPFVNASDRAHAVAAILLPFVRRMIDGPTPLHLFEAPVAGTGKSLLANVVSVIVQGVPAEARSFSNQEEEARKMLTAELARGRPLILLDNANERRKIDSPTLAAVLTAHTWSDRILGRTEMTDLPNLALWVLTANNPSVSMEIARRCIRVRIDPRQDRPWMRADFRHPNLVAWAVENRAALVRACIVLTRHWIDAGQPVGGRPLGSFERWAAVIGGILDCVGIDGFLGSLEELYEEADTEGALWREFVQAWWEAFGSEVKHVGELCRFCEEHDLLAAVLGDKSERSQQQILRKALTRRRDQVFGNLRLMLPKHGGRRNYGQGYQLAAVECQEEIPGVEAPAFRKGPSTPPSTKKTVDIKGLVEGVEAVEAPIDPHVARTHAHAYASRARNDRLSPSTPSTDHSQPAVQEGVNPVEGGPDDLRRTFDASTGPSTHDDPLGDVPLLPESARTRRKEP